VVAGTPTPSGSRLAIEGRPLWTISNKYSNPKRPEWRNNQFKHKHFVQLKKQNKFAKVDVNFFSLMSKALKNMQIKTEKSPFRPLRPIWPNTKQHLAWNLGSVDRFDASTVDAFELSDLKRRNGNGHNQNVVFFNRWCHIQATFVCHHAAENKIV
jgi:hypothetical protein